ncbi:MAG: gamma-glutamyl-gamma-aminobutyrate hydrolase family protein [Gemmatimonadaceae bacterium]
MSDPSRPLVIVGGTTETIRGVPRLRANEAYLRAVEQAGGLPLLAPPYPELVAALVARADGIVLVGGEDVDPARYGAARHPRTEASAPARDAMELALVQAARGARVPLLAICRGLQVLNVALGGTLVQDIPSERAGAVGHHPPGARDARSHNVRVAADSRLSRLLQADSLPVNSLHHQAVDRLGRGLRAVAHADDGILEAAEATDPRWWAIGVQWHPEELTATASPWDRRLFEAFVEAATARRTSAAAAPR